MRRASRDRESMSGLSDYAESRKKGMPNPQRQTPNVQALLSKTRSMTILTFLQPSVFYLNPFGKPIARWTKTKWTRFRQELGWTGGNGLTPFLILKPRLRLRFQMKWRSSNNNARTHGAKRIGNSVTNYASGSVRSDGRCAILKTDQSSPAAPDPRSTHLVHCSSNL